MRKQIKHLSILICFAIGWNPTLRAQEDLMAYLDSQNQVEQDFVLATFKTTRLVSGHSVETNAKGVTQMLIGHRFGRVNSGWRDLFGIDMATMRIGLEYSLNDNFTVGLGRSSYQKVFDGTLKYRILRQQSGKKEIPLTLTWVSSAYLQTMEWADPSRDNYFRSRLSYHHSLLIARKFGKLLSLQLMPTLVHRNLVPSAADHNLIYGLGAGGSLRLTRSIRFNTEYFYLQPNQIVTEIGGEKPRSSLSIGIDLETGGHVFQLHISNSRGMTEQMLLGQTSGDFLKGDIHLGFNISRVF